MHKVMEALRKRGLLEQRVSLGPSSTYQAAEQESKELPNETLAFMMTQRLYRVYAQERWWRAMELLELLYVTQTLSIESDLYRLLEPVKWNEGVAAYMLDTGFAEDLILTAGGLLTIEVALVRRTEELPPLSRIVLQVRKDWSIDEWSESVGTPMVCCRTRLACTVMGQEYRLKEADRE